MNNVHLIANLKSGKGAGAQLPEIAENICKELGFNLVNHDTSNHNDFENIITQAVQKAQSDQGIVIAAGGDGTIRAVAEKVQGSNLRFGVVACGTFNFFARTHKLPEELEEAFRVALQGDPQPVRLGEVNGHTFLINASLGLYAKAIRDREKRTSRWGRNRIVVIISTIVSLVQGHRLLEVSLSADNEEGGEKQAHKIKTPMIFVGNNALQLRDLSMDVAHCMKRDLLAIVLMKPLKWWETLRVIFRGFSSTIDNDEGLVSFCVEDLSIETHRKRTSWVALDGEMFRLQSPLQIKSLPDALLLMKPKKQMEDIQT